MAYLSSIPQRVRESARGGGRPLPADDPCDGRDEDDSMTVIMPDGPFGASTLPKAPLYAASRIGAAERLMRREVQRSERQSVWPRQQKPTGIPASRYHQKLIGNLPARSQQKPTGIPAMVDDESEIAYSVCDVEEMGRRMRGAALGTGGGGAADSSRLLMSEGADSLLARLPRHVETRADGKDNAGKDEGRSEVTVQLAALTQR